MTLDQAIARYTNNAEYERRNGSLQGCMEFRQLAEWLKDYKRLKEQEPCENCDYSEIMDWEQDAKTGKAKPIYWCEKHKEPCDDCISRKSIKHKLQEQHDFFVNAYGGFSNLPQNDKSRVDEIINCISMVENEPSVRPQEPKSVCDLCRFDYMDDVCKDYCPAMTI